MDHGAQKDVLAQNLIHFFRRSFLNRSNHFVGADNNLIGFAVNLEGVGLVGGVPVGIRQKKRIGGSSAEGQVVARIFVHNEQVTGKVRLFQEGVISVGSRPKTLRTLQNRRLG